MLTCAYVYAHDYGIPYDVYSSNMNNPYSYNDNEYNYMISTSTTCNIRGSVGHTLYPLCGSWGLGNNAIGSSIFTDYWLWLVWLNCMLWLPVCMLEHWYKGERSCGQSRSWSLGGVIAKHPWIERAAKESDACRTWIGVSCVTWSLCFSCQLYPFSIYFSHSVISQLWSFGQIIAVTVWVPSMVQYVYIEYSMFDLFNLNTR